VAQLLAFGGNNGKKALDELDSVDLEAIQIVRAWGYQNGHKERQWVYSPCPRPHCGGAIVSGFSDACILCARNGNSEPPPQPRLRYERGRTGRD